MAGSDEKRTKKIGIFDSGLGGLYVARSLHQAMPEYDYVYLGDTLNVPYGGRSFETIYSLSEAAIRNLFDAHNCDLIVLACNTASVSALRKLQQTFLVNEYPEKRILGVVVPTLETAFELGSKKIGLIGTEYTVRSRIYEEELRKISQGVTIIGQATPLLVPLIENQGDKYMDMILKDYLGPMIEKGLDSLVLGCTHYIAIKDRVQALVGQDVRLLSQDEIIPLKLKDYLARHPEMEKCLSKNGTFKIFATDINPMFSSNVEKLMGAGMLAQKAVYEFA